MSTASKSLLTPLKNQSVVRSVLKRIEEAVLNKELKAGDKLPSEGELARNFGIGKTSVREALRMLEALGIIETRRGEGSFIVDRPSADSINPLIYAMLLEQGSNNQILELRQMVEPMYTIMAMEKANDEQLEDLERIVERLEESVRSGKKAVELDMAFHKKVLEMTDNPFIIRIGETVLQFFSFSISRSIQSNPDICAQDHRRILEAMKQKDVDTVRQSVLQSFEGWKVNL
jgi:GntR family transcriptional repressor for pyruvate dehydrogenase complex